jgi:hypothetical protein
MITTPKYNSSPQYSVKQIQNLGAFSNAAAVTVSNTVNLTQTGILFVGAGGDVKVDTINGDTVTFKNVPFGSFLPCVVKRVYDTGTTASDILVCY